MTIPIKFRAIINKTTHIDFSLRDLTADYFSMRELVMPWLRMGNDPDCFTGIHDKNKKEIYVGDIVKQHGSYIYEVKFGLYDNGESWEDSIGGNGFYLENINYPFRMLDYLIDGDELEVIGNIKENIELLTV